MKLKLFNSPLKQSEIDDTLSHRLLPKTRLNKTAKVILGIKIPYIRKCFVDAIDCGLSNRDISLLIAKLYEFSPREANFLMNTIPLVEATKLRSHLKQCFKVGENQVFAKLQWELDFVRTNDGRIL